MAIVTIHLHFKANDRSILILMTRALQILIFRSITTTRLLWSIYKFWIRVRNESEWCRAMLLCSAHTYPGYSGYVNHARKYADKKRDRKRVLLAKGGAFRREQSNARALRSAGSPGQFCIPIWRTELQKRNYLRTENNVFASAGGASFRMRFYS